MVNQARSFLAKLNHRHTVGNVAIIIAAAYMLSRLLGLLRSRLLVTHFGVGEHLSAYNAAFRLPELLFTLLVSGAFAVAFIPVLSEHLAKDQREEAWRVTSSLLNVLVLATLVGGIFIIIFADPLTTLITPGFNKSTHDLTVQLTRIMAVTPMLFAISSILGCVQQAFGRFVVFSLAGILYNAGIIVGILVFSKHFGIYGAAYGVVFGVVLQSLLQWLGLVGLGFKWRPILSLKLKGVRQTLKLMLPRSIDQGIDQINYSIETVIGSTIGGAAIAQFSLANDLRNVPLALIGTSITTAVFPKLADRAAQGERAELVKTFVRTARLILFLAIPAAIFAVITRGYIVRLLLASGDPTVASTLGWYSATIVFMSLFLLVSRVYYALQDTRTPLYLSLASIPLNILLSIILSRTHGVIGLAMAASVVTGLETIALLIILRWRKGSFGMRSIWAGTWRMILAGAVMAPILYLSVSHFLPLYALDRGFVTLAPKFALILLIAVAAYFVPCWLLRLKEADRFITRVKDIMARSLSLV
ncbi:MAG TPA: murein biosynthesis integral membrane protein MurJ [Candidatus Saccharimonadia bacterium]|jgi:putative peptidoglycan lipid II flippase|nr:murein biosynthesis integral membrane protein MurJ [Candidatus Saccharimonadia bacterium]